MKTFKPVVSFPLNSGKAPTDHRSIRKAVVAGRNIIALFAGVAALCVAPANAQTLTSNETGTHDGYYYSFWSENENAVTFTLGSEGNYSSEWNNVGNWVGGKGWNPGARRTVSYSGSYNADGTSYLALYGWTTDPLVEYYVVENWINYNPSSGANLLGTITSDGGTYDLYRTERVDKPSIEGTATFYQYWSIRQDKRTSGTITIGNHFDGWSQSGLTLGTHDYQVMATEGYQSSGSSNITVVEGSDVPAGRCGGGGAATHCD
jgi:hypothetical protein